jgi:hypothetical protein
MTGLAHARMAEHHGQCEPSEMMRPGPQLFAMVFPKNRMPLQYAMMRNFWARVTVALHSQAFLRAISPIFLHAYVAPNFLRVPSTRCGNVCSRQADLSMQRPV